MKIAKLYQLQEYRSKALAIEREWMAQKKVLLALPGRLGYKSVKELQLALNMAANTSAIGMTGVKHNLRKTRARITTQMKQQLKKLVERGSTGKQIAERLNISIASVQGIKSQLGLIKKRGKQE